MKTNDFLKIIPAVKKTSPKWENYFFFGSLVPLILVGGLYFIIQGKVSSLRAEQANIDADILLLDSNVSNQDAQTQVGDIQKRISDFSSILKEHKYTSYFFDLVRVFCHKKVQYTEVSLNTKTSSVNLAGSADSFQALGEQLLMLNKNPNILASDASGINLQKEGKVSFNLSLKFAPGILLKNKNE